MDIKVNKIDKEEIVENIGESEYFWNNYRTQR